MQEARLDRAVKNVQTNHYLSGEFALFNFFKSLSQDKCAIVVTHRLKADALIKADDIIKANAFTDTGLLWPVNRENPLPPDFQPDDL